MKYIANTKTKIHLESNSCIAKLSNHLLFKARSFLSIYCNVVHQTWNFSIDTRSNILLNLLTFITYSFSSIDIKYYREKPQRCTSKLLEF